MGVVEHEFEQLMKAMALYNLTTHKVRTTTDFHGPIHILNIL